MGIAAHTAALLLAAGQLLAAPVAEYLCRAVPTPPTIDGRIDDACWQTADPAPPFCEVGVAGQAAQNPPRVLLVMDREALYVAIDANTAPGRPPTAVDRGRDGSTWSDDSVELRLAPMFGNRTEYQFCLNAFGSMTDFKRGPGIAPDDGIRWNGTWHTATVRRQGGWTGEMRLPWSDFGTTVPPSGWVWRAKVGLVAKGYPNAMWPRNDTQSFGNPDCWGYAVFADRNLQVNAGFEAGPAPKGPPAGWMFAYHETEGAGTCAVTDEDRAAGRWAGRLEKTDAKDWFPVFYTRELAVQPGSTYELSAMVKCDREYVMRYNLQAEGGGKRSKPMTATRGWERVTLQASVPEVDKPMLTLGWQLIRTRGVILIDDVMVRRLNDIAAIQEPVPVPHPYHRLEELAQRTAFKPYDLLTGADGWYQGDRVIFKDTATGAETWLLTRSAGASTRHMYMEITPWNADSSLLALQSGQIGRGTVVMRPDGSAWQPLPFYASGFVWDRRDPARLYFRNYRGHDKTDLWDLAIGDALTGKYEITRRFDGDLALWPLSQDGEKLLVRETVVAPDGKPHSLIWIVSRNGKDALRLDPHGLVHQTWFTKAPDYSVEFEWEGQTPAGQYCITTDGTVRMLFERTTGHRAHSPDGRWLAVMAGCAIRDKQTGDLKAIGDESSDHQTWETDPAWYCTSSGRYLRRVIAFGNETTQLLGAHNSGLKHSTYWTETHPEMSPDGTKLGYASSMLGDIEFYWLVMRRPDAPQDLHLTPTAAGVRLTWAPGRYHRETRGYLVYRADGSGRPGRQITAEPVRETELVDTQATPAAFYRATAVEHSGLESLPSNEVCSEEPWTAPAAVYVEAENGTCPPPAVEVFDAAASGLYAVTLGKLRVSPPLTVTVAVPRRGLYRLWLRVKGDGTVTASGGERALGTVNSEGKTWRWYCGDQPTTFDKGSCTVVLLASAAGVSVDRLLLCDDAAYQPVGLGGADDQAPGPVQSLKVEATGPYAVSLTWPPCREPDFAHYNVYGSSTGEVATVQERLLASPSLAQFVDWGLRPGTTCAYRVTAVDRAGNESTASDLAQTATPALPYRLLTRIDTRWDTAAQPALELRFTTPVGGQFVLWAKVQSLDGNGKAPVGLKLDGQDLGSHVPQFGYISIGHGGPVLKTWLWHCFHPARTSRTDAPGFPLPAGDHCLTLTAAPTTKLLFESFVVTNDLGVVPEGTVNFLVRPP